MTPEEREQFYDREIGPKLLELARLCEEHGLSMVNLVEWEPGETARTLTVREGAGIGLLMTSWAAQAVGNADSLVMQIMRHGREHGHNSMCLHQLGVPEKPAVSADR